VLRGIALCHDTWMAASSPAMTGITMNPLAQNSSMSSVFAATACPVTSAWASRWVRMT
jgi:hypothetical protein